MLLVQAVAAFLSLNIQEFAAVSHFELSLQVIQAPCVPLLLCSDAAHAQPGTREQSPWVAAGHRE